MSKYYIELTLTGVDGWGYATLEGAHHTLGKLCLPRQLHAGFCNLCSSPNLGLPGTVHRLPVEEPKPDPLHDGYSIIAANFSACTWSIPTHAATAIVHTR